MAAEVEEAAEVDEAPDEEIPFEGESSSSTTSAPTGSDADIPLSGAPHVGNGHPEFVLENNLYGEAFLCPMVWTARNLKPSARTWTLLLVLYTLQVSVLGFMLKMCVGALQGESQLVFGKNGICYAPDPEFITPPLGGFEASWTCLPDEVALARNFSQLDLNGDGIWTVFEACELSTRYTNKTGRIVDMPQVFTNMVARMREHNFWAPSYVGYKSKAMMKAAHQTITADPPYGSCHQWSRLVGYPIAGAGGLMIEAAIFADFYIDEIQRFLDMCLVGDPRLCGNVMTRKSWPPVFTEAEDEFNLTTNSLAAWFDEVVMERDRPRYEFAATDMEYKQGTLFEQMMPLGRYVRNPMRWSSWDGVCRNTISSFCMDLFTQQFRNWLEQKPGVCGLPSVTVSSTSDSKEPFAVTQYATCQGYNSFFGTASFAFGVFLVLMLTVWLVAGVYNLRVLSLWWCVMWQMPYATSLAQGVPCIEDTSEGIRMNAMPRYHWWRTFFLLLLARTLLESTLTVVGLLFLISTQKVQDLILNSLALAFVAEIDDILYAAFTPHRHKRWVESFQPVQLNWRSQSHRRWGHLWDWRAHLVRAAVALQAGIALILVAKVYFSSHGRVSQSVALSCACEKAGAKCLEAQLLCTAPSLTGANLTSCIQR